MRQRHEFSAELLAKADAAKSPEEVLQLAKAEGIELSDEEVAAISGGDGWGSGRMRCPNCKSINTSYLDPNVGPISGDVSKGFKCNDCGHVWIPKA